MDNIEENKNDQTLNKVNNTIKESRKRSSKFTSIGFVYQNSAVLAANKIHEQRNMIDTIPKIEFPTVVMPSVAEFELTQFQNNLSPVNDRFMSLGQSIQKVFVNSTPSITKMISNDLSLFIQSIVHTAFSSMFDALHNLKFDFDFEEYEEQYLYTMYESRWFPYVGQTVPFLIIRDINEIISSTRQSKNRIKKIDACIFSYYNDSELNDINRSWRSLNLPSYIMRILRQAIKAYKNKEYAVTTIVLSSLWEGIVADKASHNEYRIAKKTKENFNALIMSNDFPTIFSDFYNQYIMYDCHSVDDVIDDVPGRHGISHGWYSKYPSRKAALNGIVFTDLLLQLKPIQMEGDKNDK